MRTNRHQLRSAAEFSPEELRKFKRRVEVWDFFQSTPQSYTRVIVQWVTSSKKAKTRASRFSVLLNASATGQRLR